MAKSEWGNKWVCQSCGTKFYDLKKSSVRCPSCDEPHDGKPTKAADAKRAKAAESKRAKPAAKPEPVKAAPKAKAQDEPPPPSMDDDDTESGSKKDVDDADLAKDIQTDEADDDEEEEPIEDASELGGTQDEVAEVIEVKVEKESVER